MAVFHRGHDFTEVILSNQKNDQEKKPLLELISEYSKVVRYKGNIQKSIPLLYASNEPVDSEINIISLTLVPPKLNI